ncbi:MAG: Yip1 family protein [Hyphomonadaceae bacterium]|nr:Yip1 family protein [Hyphomonadaceae bacterium]
MKAVIARVKDLLISPKTEWDVIGAEDVAPRRLVAGFVAPMLAIPAVATVVGLSVVGVGGVAVPLVPVVVSAIVFYVLAVAGIVLFAAAISFMAPRFGGQASFRQALKVSAYSITAATLAGVTVAIPALGIFATIGAVYSLYLLFLGAPKVMHASGASAVNFSIVTTMTAVVFALVAGLAAMAVMLAAGVPPERLTSYTSVDGAEAASAATERVKAETAVLPPEAGKLRDAPAATVTTGDLRDAAPVKLAGLDRVSVSVERSGVGGARTVRLEADYQRGARYISLQVILSASIAQTIGFGGASTSEYDLETTDGYARRRRIGDAIVTEEWNNTSGTGSYGRLVNDRFYVKAAGRGGISPAELRKAVELFGQGTLAQFEAES